MHFYDIYVEMLQEMVDILKHPQSRDAYERAMQIDAMRESLEQDPDYLANIQQVSPLLLDMVSAIRKAGVYILSQDVARLALDICEKAGDTPLPYEPFLKIPLWVELEQATIGDENYQFAAMSVYRLANELRCDLLSPDMQRVKTLLFSETGEWEYEQQGSCISKECSVAPYTLEGEPYRIRQQDHKYGTQCICWQAGQTWAQIVRAINHLLKNRKQDPLMEDIEAREIALPYRTPKTFKEKTANSRAKQASRPNVITLSLSTPVSVTRRTSGQIDDKERISVELVEETLNVAAHWKYLIPGEGKPWKAFKIVKIESYERHQKPGTQRTRYRVEE